MFRRTVMRAGRKILTGVLPLAVVATFAGAGAASATDYAAQQARLAENLVASGSEQDISYRTTVAPDLKTITTTLDSGKFTLAADSSVVKVENAAGAKVTQFPLALKTVAGNTIPLNPQISADGKTLMMTPQVSPEVTAEAKTIATTPGAQNSDPIANGAAAGAIVGVGISTVLCLPGLLAFIVGFFPCFLLSVLPNVLIAAVIGAIIGAVAPDVIPQILP